MLRLFAAAEVGWAPSEMVIDSADLLSGAFSCRELSVRRYHLLGICCRPFQIFQRRLSPLVRKLSRMNNWLTSSSATHASWILSWPRFRSPLSKHHFDRCNQWFAEASGSLSLYLEFPEQTFA